VIGTYEPFAVEPAGQTIFGPGRIEQLPDLIADLGGEHVFVVTDPGVVGAGIAERVLGILGAAGIQCTLHAEIGPNPSTATLDTGAKAAADARADVVLALGGGSSLDAAKGIALLAANRSRTAADADALWTEAEPGLPLVAVPTTSGTGAETNGFGVFEDTAACKKVYLGHDSVVPLAALLDPELTLGLPARVTAATGLDALVHGVESLASRGANAVSVAYAAQAVALVGRWLPRAYWNGDDLEARAQLMLGAHLGGRALTISGLGLVHGIGHALTAHTGTPHGVALAAVFEEVMEFSVEEAALAYEQAARSLKLVPPVDGDWAGAAIEAVREISGSIEIKRPLRDLGVTKELMPRIAADAVADAVTKNAPRLPVEQQVLELLESVY
jgi:alcohol dehydrogenase